MDNYQSGAVSKGFLITASLLIAVIGGAIFYMRSDAYLPPEMQAMMAQTESGNVEAIMNNFEQRRRADIRELKPLAEKGDVQAQRKIARLLLSIRDKDSPAEAFGWASKAAASGNAGAQHELARYYECGIGTERNLQQAIRLYTPAAEKGNVMAMYALTSIESDPKKIKIWSDRVARAMSECRACDLPSGGCN